jgi:hypothetical protein
LQYFQFIQFFQNIEPNFTPILKEVNARVDILSKRFAFLSSSDFACAIYPPGAERLSTWQKKAIDRDWFCQLPILSIGNSHQTPSAHTGFCAISSCILPKHDIQYITIAHYIGICSIQEVPQEIGHHILSYG